MDSHVNSEEENISAVGSCAAHRNLKRSKLIIKSTSTISSLPDDVVFDILARVPAHDIHSAARLVCHKWYRTTRTHDFVRAHLQQSTCGLVFQPIDSKRDSKFATQKGPIMEIISHFDYKFTGSIFSSCNGLILVRHFKNPGWEIHITNPATKQQLVLPTIDVRPNYFFMGLVYAVASKKYKAVRTTITKAGKLECAILTVGVDEDWKRRVDIRHLSPSAKDLLFAQTPLYTDGFVHWAAQDSSGRDSECVVTLNVETEIITQFPALPPNLIVCGCDGETKLLYRYLPMGRCLSLLIARVDNKLFSIWDQVWVMEPETGEWTKMTSINSESLKSAIQGVNHTYCLVGWLKSREVLVFASSSSSSCIAYNVRTHEIESFELGFNPRIFVPHRNSLVWLDGC